MIRVLHVINSFDAGGVETQLLQILAGYDRNQFQMDVCAIGGERGSLAGEAEKLGSEILLCKKSPNFLSFSRRFAKLLKGRDYDVVHSHLEPWGGPLLRGAHGAKVPVRIVELHNEWPFTLYENESRPSRFAKTVLAEWGLRWVRRYSTHLLAVSKAVVDARWPAAWDKTRIIVWNAGVDLDRWLTTSSADTNKDGPPKIIWVGGLRTFKRVDLQLRVFDYVRKSIPEARLVIVGEGYKKTELEDMAENMGMAGSVDFLGLRRDVPDLLRSASLFLTCAEAEGLPTVLMEAQASGLPVVASNIAPHREALSPALQPYIFERDEPESAARSIIRILSDPQLRADLGHAGREFAAAEFCGSTQLGILQDYYRLWVESRTASHAL